MPAPVKATAASHTPDQIWVACLAAWLVPGLGHVLNGQARKGLTFFVVLVGMFVIGLQSGGRLFPFQTSDVLVTLAALAQWALGGARLIGALGGLGPGVVTASTYEYGNTFLIAAGLLNVLIVLDVFDLASGRKVPR